FQRLGGEHQAERHVRGFSCWDQFVAMLFGQLAQAKSLRKIRGGPGSFFAMCSTRHWIMFDKGPRGIGFVLKTSCCRSAAAPSRCV
ncbi:MAG: DUF4372 domain-containing protein, partial [Deltaproteobacteria bacterium]|nr:DUF4372 domain-containing protein [Deltaproteobacteria bacterium]